MSKNRLAVTAALAVLAVASLALLSPGCGGASYTLKPGQLSVGSPPDVIPFETFVEIGLDLKKRSPFPRTMVVGIANGYNGYLPTPEQHKLGGYETWFGTCKVQEDASVILTDQLLAMLTELAKL